MLVVNEAPANCNRVIHWADGTPATLAAHGPLARPNLRAELERRATSEGLSLSALVRRALDAELSGT